MNKPSIPHVVVFALIGLLFVGRAQGKGLQAAPAVQRPPEIYGDIGGELVRQTPHFQIYVEKGFTPVDLDWLAAEAEVIHTYLSGRMGASVDERFALTVRPPDTRPCPIRGFASWESSPVAQAIVFADEKTSRAQVVGILAHEIAHLFHGRALKLLSINQDLTEGLATWGAGKYWEAWHRASLADAVRSFKSDGRYRPLGTYFLVEAAARPPLEGESCLKDRDLRYGSWAAFIDFLISRYGLDKLKQLFGREGQVLFATPQMPLPNLSRIGGIGLALSATPFQEVYGLSLEELEKTWWEQLDPSAKFTAQVLKPVQMELSADIQVLDGQVLRLLGNAEIRSTYLHVSADQILVETATQQVTAQRNVVLTIGTSRDNTKLKFTEFEFNPSNVASALYVRAASELDSGRYSSARELFLAIVTNFEDSQQVEYAKFGMGDSLMRDGTAERLAQAEHEFADFITFFPNSALIPAARQSLTQIRQKLAR